MQYIYIYHFHVQFKCRSQVLKKEDASKYHMSRTLLSTLIWKLFRGISSAHLPVLLRWLYRFLVENKPDIVWCLFFYEIESRMFVPANLSILAFFLQIHIFSPNDLVKREYLKRGSEVSWERDFPCKHSLPAMREEHLLIWIGSLSWEGWAHVVVWLHTFSI